MKGIIIASAFLLTYTIVIAQKQKLPKSKNEVIEVPFTPDSWIFNEGKVEFLTYKGRQSVKLNGQSGGMICKNLQFSDGTIEFDAEVTSANPFPQLYFRWKNENEAEHVYLRTGVKKMGFDAVQYASIINGVNIWDLQHEFQSAADIKVGEWNHVKLVVSGKRLRVYVNNVDKPILDIPCMEGNTTEGSIAILSSFEGTTYFSNLVVKPNETEGLNGEPAPDITRHDTRYIRNWQVSQPEPLPHGTEINLFAYPQRNDWENIHAEQRGLINLSRKFGRSDSRRVVWLRATIQSENEQSQVLKLGFSDDVWVLVNRKPVYVDKSIYALNMRKSPNGRISLDNSSFPIQLVKGENEILIAVANDFYGWGIIARLENVNGLEF